MSVDDLVLSHVVVYHFKIIAEVVGPRGHASVDEPRHRLLTLQRHRREVAPYSHLAMIINDEYAFDHDDIGAGAETPWCLEAPRRAATLRRQRRRKDTNTGESKFNNFLYRRGMILGIRDPKL